MIELSPIFRKSLLPCLNEHFVNLNKEPAEACTFQNISLTPGWMVVGENAADDGQTEIRKKKKKLMNGLTGRQKIA